MAVYTYYTKILFLLNNMSLICIFINEFTRYKKSNIMNNNLKLWSYGYGLIINVSNIIL